MFRFHRKDGSNHKHCVEICPTFSMHTGFHETVFHPFVASCQQPQSSQRDSALSKAFSPPRDGVDSHWKSCVSGCRVVERSPSWRWPLGVHLRRRSQWWCPWLPDGGVVCGVRDTCHLWRFGVGARKLYTGQRQQHVKLGVCWRYGIFW